MSTKRNTKKFRKKLRKKNSSNGFKKPSNNKPKIVIYDLGVLDNMVKEYSKDITSDYEIIENRLNLTRRFPTMGDVKIIITKTKDGYNYEDIGMFTRNFTDLDFMIWEFELPKSLKEVIRNLPVIDECEDNFITDTMEEIMKVTSKSMVDFMKENRVIY